MPRECPYRSAKIHARKVAKVRSTKWSIPKIFSHSITAKTATTPLDVKCVLCNRKFILVKFNDLKWIVNGIKCVLNAIRRFIKYEMGYSTLPSDTACIAFRDKKRKMDVCFNHPERRACIRCVKE